MFYLILGTIKSFQHFYTRMCHTDWNLHTVDNKTVTPALKETGSAVNSRNTWCMIFKLSSFNNKRLVSMLLILSLTVILLLEQHITIPNPMISSPN